MQKFLGGILATSMVIGPMLSVVLPASAAQTDFPEPYHATEEGILYRSHEIVVRWHDDLREFSGKKKLQRTLDKKSGAPLRRLDPTVVRDQKKRNFSVIASRHLTTKELMKRFRDLPTIAAVHENIIFSTQSQSVEWGVDASAGTNARAVQTSGTTGSGVIVAVIDTGIDLTHEDLDANLWKPTDSACTFNGVGLTGGCPNGGYDIVNDDVDPSDDNGHGTHVSGIIAAADNNVGTVGVAPNAMIMALKTMDANGSGNYTDIVTAIDFAVENGASVINMSIGTMNAGIVLQELQEALDDAEAAGVTVVSAAGNNASAVAFVPSLFEHVISVGSIQETASADNPDANYNTRLSYFSNFGKINVVAPGSEIVSAYLDNTYATLSGTSMAAPHVAGVVALLKAKNANLTPAQIRNILQSTAQDLGTAGKDEFFGAGLVNAQSAVESSIVSSTTHVRLDGNGSTNRTDPYGQSYYLEPAVSSTILPADGASTTTVQAVVATDDGTAVANETVTLTTTAGTITSANAITTDAAGNAEFTIRASATAGTATVTATLASTNETSMITLRFADTLLVTDAGQPIAADIESWFILQALEQNGVSWKMSTQAFPAAETTLAAFPRVMWHTERGSLDEDEQTLIKNYLDQGGNLFLSGGDILYTYYYYSTISDAQPSLGKDIIFSDYLHVAYKNYIASALELVGNGIMASTGAELADFGSTNQNFGYTDVLDLTLGGQSQGYYCSEAEDAIVVIDGAYKVVLVAAALDGNASASDGSTIVIMNKQQRAEILAAGIAFLSGTTAPGGTFTHTATCDDSDSADVAAEDLPTPGLPDTPTSLGEEVLSNLSVTARTDSTVSVSWETSEVIASSLLYAANNATEETEAFREGDATSGTVTDLQPHTDYTFNIYGVYDDGTQTGASSIAVRTLPQAPDQPILTKATKTAISLRLTDPRDTGLQFLVELRNKKNTKTVSSTTLEEGDATVTFPDLSPDKTYYVRAQFGYIDAQTDETVMSAYSKKLKVYTATDQVAKPTIKKKDIRSDAVLLRWKKPTGKIAQYIIQVRRRNDNGRVTLVSTITVRSHLGKKSQNLWIRNLLSSRRYLMRVRADFRNGTKGRYSPSRSLRTEAM